MRTRDADWNCHSLVAAALNRVEHRPDVLARCFGGWTVGGVALLFFRQGLHVGTAGVLMTWGPHAAIWLGVLLGCVRDGSAEWLRGWLYLQAALLAFWALWFGLLAACRCNSQFGRCEAAEDGAEPGEADVESPRVSRSASPLGAGFDADRPIPIRERAALGS